uniref:MARVEL domain-containing protein n=1 Tax=Syphacia muris TaxID=451379 RepID=A0A0N5AHM8_9BILA
MVEIDKEFPKAWPFGVIKTVQWLSCLLLLITLWCTPGYFSGIGFVFFSAWNLLIVALLSWLGHIFGLQSRLFSIGQSAACFIPFALIDFFYSILFFIFFAISTLICIACLFMSFGYAAAVRLVLGYLFSTVFCLAAAGSCAFLTILLYRSAPNGQIMGLRSIVIQGEKTASFGPSSGPGAYPAASGYPNGTNPV